ncbi:hypothetical protein [Halostella sp. PRR32]|uniref:hypothetical protein n=1 Tax=Halostella sp. PRR32 TaxID=3098147 RepID=UPI002B1E5C1F|nr:hypothetical protein [Halostella sp. PRR32]
MLSTETHDTHRSWVVGFGGLLVAFAGLYALPLTRSYVLYTSLGADQFVHLGTVQDLLETGRLARLQYPGGYLVTASLGFTTGATLESLVPVLAFLFSTLFTGLLGACVWSLTKKRTLVLTTLLASFPLYFASHRFFFMPYLFALSPVPLLVMTAHLYLRSGRRKQVGPYLLAAVACTFYHPLTMLFGLLMVAGYFAVYRDVSNVSLTGPETTLLSVSAMIVLSWYIIGGILDHHLHTVGVRLLGQTTGAIKTTSQAGGFGLWHTMILLLENFGVLLALFSLGGIVVVHILWRRGAGSATKFEWFVASQFVIAGGVSTVFFIARVWSLNVPRITQYLILIAIMSVGVGLSRARTWAGQRSTLAVRAVSVCIVALIVTLTLFSAGVAYDDGKHLTEATVSGYGWTLDEKAAEDPILLDSPRDTFAFYHYGYTSTITDKSKQRIFGHSDPPHRYGYADNETIGSAMGPDAPDTYLVIRDADTDRYHTRPEWQQEQMTHYYTETDRERALNDPTVNYIYANGEMDVLLAEGDD